MLLFLGSLVTGYLYLQAGRILYYKYGYAYWQTQHPAACSPYRQSYFENLQPQAQAPELDYRCPQALTLPARSAYAQSADGVQIHYRIFESPLQTAPLLLHVSGFTSDWLNGARYVKAAERMGFQLISMEMRGHGQSQTQGQGVAYGCREQADVLAVVDALQQHFPERLVYLWGSSGGTMAIVNAAKELSSRSQIKAVLLENPISALQDVARVKSPGLPEPVYGLAIGMASWRSGLDFVGCAPVQKAAELTLPTLVTVSEQDTLTPVWMAQKLFAALGGVKRFKRYPQGLHERIWNAQPLPYEADLKQHWLAAQSEKQKSIF